MNDYSKLKALALEVLEIQKTEDRPIGDAWSAFEAAAEPAVVLGLIDELDVFRAVAAQPSSLSAMPSPDYDGLKRQFFALRNYALCKDKLAGYYSREFEGLRSVDRSQSAAEIDAERSINEQLTNDLLGAEAVIEALRKDAERYRWLRQDDVEQYEISTKFSEEKMDSAIDAAMSKQAQS